jgi:uncharacterized protein YjbI with pentapeptide repeats
MHIEAQRFETALEESTEWSDNLFRYCNFVKIDSEGGCFDSVFVGCTFENCEWYSGLFNCAILVNVKFIGCKFLGTAFSSSKFVECTFIDCEFTTDNLMGKCVFDGVAWYKCTQQNCSGLEGEFCND